MQYTTNLAYHIKRYIQIYLPNIKGLSQNTIYSYRDNLTIFLRYCESAKNIKIEKMSLEQITPELITDFLDYLESTMKYSASSRNQRLAALRTFFRYLMHDDVTYISLTQDVLSIPMKKTKEQHNERKKEIMEKCFECYAENGLTGTGIKALAAACNCTTGNLYCYFKNIDELILESTAYCMTKVEDDFMEKAPTDPKDVLRFIEEVPYWTAKKHGKKYRLMYQVYTLPKYIEYGKKFFEGVNERYTEYAKQLEPKIGIPHTVITPLIFIFVRACVHYAMFEDEYYLKTQMEVLKQGVALFVDKYKANQA